MGRNRGCASRQTSFVSNIVDLNFGRMTHLVSCRRAALKGWAEFSVFRFSFFCESVCNATVLLGNDSRIKSRIQSFRICRRRECFPSIRIRSGGEISNVPILPCSNPNLTPPPYWAKNSWPLRVDRLLPVATNGRLVGLWASGSYQNPHLQASKWCT